jgi:hypothetical protein
VAAAAVTLPDSRAGPWREKVAERQLMQRLLMALDGLLSKRLMPAETGRANLR